MLSRNIGDNNPPDMAQTARDTTGDLNDFLKENPVIESEESAREAKLFLDRGKLCVKDLEDERKGKTRPLESQITAINDYYREPRGLLQRVIDELGNRITAFIAKEEAKRLLALEEARRKREAAEQAAREAERREQENIEAASLGELDVDIAAATSEADAEFAAYQKAARQEAIAERDTKVKIGGGFTRAISLRRKEEPVIVDAMAAIGAIGITDGIQAAIIKDAKSYKRLNGKWPTGIEAEISKSV